MIGSLQGTLDNFFSDDTSPAFASFSFFGNTRSLGSSRSWDASDESAGRLVDLDSRGRGCASTRHALSWVAYTLVRPQQS
jgi:hypothetical protein